jgi:hypothetical protein
MALFEKGNPGGGRPKMPPEERERWKAVSSKSLKGIEDLLEADKAPPLAILLKIAEISADRAYGKPVQAIDAEVTERRPIIIDGAYGEKDEPGQGDSEREGTPEAVLPLGTI